MDLRTMFGDRYVVTMEGGLEVETAGSRPDSEGDDVSWRYTEIKGKRGMVYPYSETQVAVVLPTRAAHRLMKLMGSELTLLQHADDAMCFKADAKYAAVFVRFIRPKRLRQLTAEHKAALAARIALYRFHSPKSSQISGGGLAGKRSARHLVPQGAYPANPPPASRNSQNKSSVEPLS